MKKLYLVVILSRKDWTQKMDSIFLDRDEAVERKDYIRKRINKDKYLVEVQMEIASRGRNNTGPIELPLEMRLAARLSNRL